MDARYTGIEAPAYTNPTKNPIEEVQADCRSCLKKYGYMPSKILYPFTTRYSLPPQLPVEVDGVTVMVATQAVRGLSYIMLLEQDT